MTKEHPFIAGLENEAKGCEAAEAEFRNTMNAKVAELAQARAFAFRRMNVMRSLFDTVASAEDEEIAITKAVKGLRDRLGWIEDSEAREEVLAHYAMVARAAFHATHPDDRRDEADDVPAEPATALSQFEAWYASSREKPFWVLFEHYMPETQLVDF